jgi:hypothetical protein
MLFLRVFIITIFFGIAGYLLAHVLRIIPIAPYYEWMPMPLAALCALLVFYFLNDTFIKKGWLLVFFGCFILCAAVNIYIIVKHTFEYEEFSGINRYVKGEYSSAGLKLKSVYFPISDEQLLRQHLKGPEFVKILWTPDSVDSNILLLILSYGGIVIFGVVFISAVIKSSRFSSASVKDFFMAIFRERATCKTFYDVKSRTIDISGLKLGVADKFDMGMGSLKMDTQSQQVTDSLQKLDLLQFGLCNDIKGVKDPAERDKLLARIIATKTRMLELIATLT